MAQHELDQLYVTNPTNYKFTVKWGGREYTLEPGQQIVWMRFLAEHFAKHLTDSILMKREQAHKKAYLDKGGSERDYIPKSYLNSRTMRPEVVASILTGVYQYHQADNADPNSMIQQQIDQMNPQGQIPGQPKERETDLGEAPSALLGVLTDDDEDEQETPPQAAPAPDGASMLPGGSDTPPAAPVPAGDGRGMKELQAEAKKLGITVPFGATKDTVREMIRKQYA
jgi:hypothetical protein